MEIFFAMLVMSTPAILLVFWALNSKSSSEPSPITDLEMIRFIKTQEMIEGMKHVNKNQ